MHQRKRHIEHVLSKRANIFPVLGVLGPRQVGKSTFLMKQWCELTSAVYMTFDEHLWAMRAKRAPEQLLLDKTDGQKIPLIIDEAHKVPHVFDSIKAMIDKQRRMAAFTLSGSVEFSSKSGVRESLAGRMGISRLYPLTLRELDNQAFQSPWVTRNFSHAVPSKAKTVDRWLDRGGMPTFCQLSDIDERISLINSWLEALCYRDLQQLQGTNYDSEVAYGLLQTLAANQDQPLRGSKLAADLGASSVAIKKHLAALASLFILYKIPSFENPRARPIYRLFDAGVLNALLGGQESLSSRHASLVTLLINEIYAQYEYAGKRKPNLYYYRTRGGAEIDLVLKTNNRLLGIECVINADIPDYRQRGMRSFLDKYKEATGYFVAPVPESYQLAKNIIVVPWCCIG